jgi:uncharacterized protein (TIGR03000 family)
MYMRGFSLASYGALALLLLAAEACPAQVVFFPGGRRTGFVGTGVGFPIGPNYYPNYYRSGTTYMPPTSYSSFAQYSTITPTPLYYGAASSMYYGGASYGTGQVTGRLVSPAPGAGLRADAVSEAAYTAPVYPLRTPTYSSIYPVSPPLAVAEAYTAKVEVRAPAEAEIWFEGQKTSQCGTDRMFSSPTLESGQEYFYDVRACWSADGKAVDQTRKVRVRAGERVRVDFLRP